MLTLWDLIEPIKQAVQARVRPNLRPPQTARSVSVPSAHPVRQPTGRAAAEAKTRARSESMQTRYDSMTRDMLARYNVRVRKWRSGMSGIAWYVTYKDGKIVRLIEAPKPKGPMSAAIFLHEIGHHAIGFNTYKPRCLEEYHAWQFALHEMQRLGLNITGGIHRRVDRSLKYAVRKAQRRGIKQVPPELARYTVDTR